MEKHKEFCSLLKKGDCLPADQEATAEQQMHLKNYLIKFSAQLPKLMQIQWRWDFSL